MIFKVKEQGVTRETYHGFERYQPYSTWIAVVNYEDSVEVWALEHERSRPTDRAITELKRYYRNQFDADPRMEIYERNPQE